jgi:hypothetical protein
VIDTFALRNAPALSADIRVEPSSPVGSEREDRDMGTGIIPNLFPARITLREPESMDVRVNVLTRGGD